MRIVLAGLGLIITSIIILIIADVYPLVRDYIIKTIPSLAENPFMIIEIIAFCMMGIGVILITNDKHRWVQKLVSYLKDQNSESTVTIVREDPYNVKTHLQTLNSLYQKLSVIRLAEQPNYSYNIETIENYDDWKMNRGLSNALGSYVKNELYWIHAKDFEPNLKRALTHLEQHDNHKNIVELWNKLQTQVNEYNKSIPKLVKFLENHIRTIMKEKTNYREYPKEDQDRGYRLDNIQKTLMIGFYLQLAQPESVNSFLSIELKPIENLHVWYDDFEGGYPLITVKKEDEKPDINQIQNLLLSIIKDENVLKECKPHHDLYVKIIKHTSKEFQNAMRNLVEDIENHGYVVEGKCDLGY